MMKFRKLTAIILTLVICVSMLSAFALADGDPTFRGDNIEAKAGEKITYKVFIENNPGIAGYKVEVDFSPEAFDLDSADGTDEFKNPIKVRLGDFSDEEGNVVGNPTKYGCVALYFNTTNVESDGVAFTVTLNVKEDAVNGSHAVKIRYDAKNTVYVDETTGSVLYAPEFKTVDGTVTVTGGEEGVIDNEAVGPTEEELKEIEESRKTPASRLPGTNNTGTDDRPSESDPTTPGFVPGDEQVTQSQGGTTENKPDVTPSGGSSSGGTPSGGETAEGNTNGGTNNTQLTHDDETATGSTGRNVTNSGAAGSGTTKIILIAAAAVVVIAVILIFVLKALTGKRPEDSGDEDKDIDINEVLGLKPTEDDYNDGDDDDDDVDD